MMDRNLKARVQNAVSAVYGPAPWTVAVTASGYFSAPASEGNWTGKWWMDRGAVRVRLSRTRQQPAR